MNNRSKKIEVPTFNTIDKPKYNFKSIDINNNNNNKVLIEFKNKNIFNLGFSNEIDNNDIKINNRYGNFKNSHFEKIKRNMMHLKNEIKKLNILAHKNQEKEFSLNKQQKSLKNNKYYNFGSKYKINRNFAKNNNDINLPKKNYLFLSANKQKKNSNDIKNIYLSPDINRIKTQKSDLLDIHYYKGINNNNRKLFKKINEKNEINNKIEFNNQNVNHQIIIINSNNPKISMKESEDEKEFNENKKIRNCKNNINNDDKKDNNINMNRNNNKDNNLKKNVNREIECDLENSLINDDELNIPLIIEILKYNKVMIDINNIEDIKSKEDFIEKKKNKDKKDSEEIINNKIERNKEIEIRINPSINIGRIDKNEKDENFEKNENINLMSSRLDISPELFT